MKKNTVEEVARTAPFVALQNSSSKEKNLISNLQITYADSLKSKSPHIKPLDEVLIEIKEGEYGKEIEAIRNAFINSGKETANNLKVGLPVFYPSAILEGGLKSENITEYVPIIQIDFDDIPVGQLDDLRSMVKASPLTLCCFISPKGNGLKVLVKINTQQNEHKEVFKAANAYYKELTGFDSDLSINNVNRACFVSYDPNLYYNASSETFVFKSELTFEDNSLNSIWSFTENQLSYIEGSRNNFLFLFANNCNRKGIDFKETLEYSYNRASGLPKHQIEATVKSAFKNTYDHGSYKNVNLNTAGDTKGAVRAEAKVKHEYEGLPDELYKNLPELIRPIFDSYEGSKRDFFLISLLTIIGGALKNVCGQYGDKTCHTNIFTFIVAAAASGKSIMLKAQELCSTYDNKLMEEKKYGGLFYGGNISTSRLIELVYENGGTGVLFESEADTVANTMKQEWGNLTAFLRKSFEGEGERFSRKTNDEHFILTENRISVLLSGTPNQINNLIKSPEDGFFSRFLFVKDETDPEWKSQKPNYKNKYKIIELEETLKLSLYNMFMLYRNNDLEVRLSDETWDMQDKIFSKLTDDAIQNGLSDESSVVFRLGNIFFRLCMILTAIEESQKINIEDEEYYYEDIIYCSEQNAETAMEICLLGLKNSIDILGKFDKTKDVSNSPDNFLFNKLPQSFERSKAIEIGVNDVKLSTRAIDNKLKKWLNNGQLIQEKRGVYIKNIK